MNKSKELNRAYDQWHLREHDKDDRKKVNLGPWHRNVINVMPDLNEMEECNILEVGTGPGDFSLCIANVKLNITAFDFSKEAIKIAKEKAIAQNKNIDFLVADAQNMPFEDNHFDFLFSFECLEHIPEPMKMIEECYRVLKPGGKMYLTTENYSNGLVLLWIKSWLKRRTFNSGTDQPIENFFVFWKLIRKFKRAGFNMLDYFGTHHVFLILPGMHPHTFVRDRFSNKSIANLMKGFARHMTYILEK